MHDHTYMHTHTHTYPTQPSYGRDLFRSGWGFLFDYTYVHTPMYTLPSHHMAWIHSDHAGGFFSIIYTHNTHILPCHLNIQTHIYLTKPSYGREPYRSGWGFLFSGRGRDRTKNFSLFCTRTQVSCVWWTVSVFVVCVCDAGRGRKTFLCSVRELELVVCEQSVCLWCVCVSEAERGRRCIFCSARGLKLVVCGEQYMCVCGVCVCVCERRRERTKMYFLFCTRSEFSRVWWTVYVWCVCVCVFVCLNETERGRRTFLCSVRDLS